MGPCCWLVYFVSLPGLSPIHMHARPHDHTHLSACLAQTQGSDPLEERTFIRPVARPAEALNSHFLFTEPWESISAHCDHQSGILGSKDTSGLEQLYVKSKENVHTCLGRDNTTVCIICHYCQSWRNLNKVLKYSPVQLSCTGSFSYFHDKTIGKEVFVLFTVQGCSPLQAGSRCSRSTRQLVTAHLQDVRERLMLALISESGLGF